VVLVSLSGLETGGTGDELVDLRRFVLLEATLLELLVRVLVFAAVYWMSDNASWILVYMKRGTYQTNPL
jgi:hypothetical protein